MLRRIDNMVLTSRGRIVDIRNIDMFDNNNIFHVAPDSGRSLWHLCFVCKASTCVSS